VSGVLNWERVQLGDPALDFAWLADEDNELLEAILLNYQLNRPVADGNIAKRAVLYSELEWVRWLVHGYAVKDTIIVEDAVKGLQAMAQAAAEGKMPPLTASAVAAAAAAVGSMNIIESVSFIEQDEAQAVDSAAPTKPIDIIDESDLF